MIDRKEWEGVIRERLRHLGFDLTRDGFDYLVSDRRMDRGLAAMPPTRCQELEGVIELFKIEL
jgi:hypothetical protein